MRCSAVFAACTAPLARRSTRSRYLEISACWIHERPPLRADLPMIQTSKSQAHPLSIVLIVSPDPVGAAPSLVPALRHQIKVVIVEIQLVVAPVVARVGVKDRTARVLVKDAVPLPLAR